MRKENSVLTIDVGSDSVKVAEFVVSPAGVLTMRDFAWRKLGGIPEGQIAEPEGEEDIQEQRRREFTKAFLEITSEHNFQAKRVRLSLPASSSFLRLSKLPDAIGNSTTIRKVVEMEAGESVPCSMEDVEWDYQLIKYIKTETLEEKDEEGNVTESQVESDAYEAMFVAMRTDDISVYSDIIEELGFKLISVTIAPAALFNATRCANILDGNQCELMLNIGGKASSIIIADHNRIFIRSIPLGGDSITAMVAKEFSVSLAEAEEIKRRHGFVALGGAYEEAESEVATSVSRIARNVMTRLHGEMSRSINVWRAQHHGNRPVRILLSGGGTVMPYVADFVQEKMNVPVEFLNVFGTINIGETVDRELLQSMASMSQELVGMALREVTECPIEISLLPRTIQKKRSFEAKMPYFFAASGVFVLGLLLFLLGVYRLCDFKEKQVRGVREAYRVAERVNRDMTRLINDMNAKKGDFENAEGILADRFRYIEIINCIIKSAPPSMWITTMELLPSDESKDSRRASERRSSGRRGRRRGDNRQAESEVMVTEDPNGVHRHISIEEMAAAEELGRIRLVGYAVVTKGDTLQTMTFKENLEKFGQYFDRVEVKRNSVSSKMVGFEYSIVLKQPIRK